MLLILVSGRRGVGIIGFSRVIDFACSVGCSIFLCLFWGFVVIFLVFVSLLVVFFYI